MNLFTFRLDFVYTYITYECQNYASDFFRKKIYISFTKASTQFFNKWISCIHFVYFWSYQEFFHNFWETIEYRNLGFTRNIYFFPIVLQKILTLLMTEKYFSD